MAEDDRLAAADEVKRHGDVVHAFLVRTLQFACHWDHHDVPVRLARINLGQ